MQNNFPQILSLREQDELSVKILHSRLDTILPEAMRQANLDMWIILCQEDDYDPVFKTMIPLRTWAPILQMLVFHAGPSGVERINLSMTNLRDLFAKPWNGVYHTEQWPLLAQIVAERDPQRIGINNGGGQWAAGGLTQNLHTQLVACLEPKYAERLVSAEAACTHWLSVLTPEELQFYPHVVEITKHIIAECFSAKTITPGLTTTDDLQWAFWQISQTLGLEQSFIPFFNLVRSNAEKARYPVEDKIIRPGDLIHCDVGNRYLRLCSDLQEWAYVRRVGEADAPPGLQNLFSQVNRLQHTFMDAFEAGLTGDQLLNRILSTAKAQGIPSPKVYSHSLGYYLHEPGPLIGLPWEQTTNPGRGDVPLTFNTTFTMELAIADSVPEWDGQVVNFGVEQDVCFTESGCQPMKPLQCAYHLI
jgi:Xaa-Pro aminopeptidase